VLTDLYLIMVRRWTVSGGAQTWGSTQADQTGSNKQTKGASNTSKSDKKTVRVCNYFNNQKCRFDSNHERGDVCWLHVCAKCKKAWHIDSECTFLKKWMLS
jgi:ribosomal protein L28